MKRIMISLLTAVSFFSLSCSKNSGGGGTDNPNNNNPSEFAIDKTFSNTAVRNGKMSGAVQADGKIIVGGLGFYRLNKDGSIDNTFNPPAALKDESVFIRAIKVMGNGKIMVAGTFKIATNINLVARLNADGSIDNSFVPLKLNSPSANTSSPAVNDLFVQQDGKVIVVGFFSYPASGTNKGGEDIVRLNTDGSADYSFYTNISPNGGNGYINAITQQKDGKLLIGGTFTAISGSQTRTTLVRLASDGTPDLSFTFQDMLVGTLGFQGVIYTLLLQEDGKILIGGNFYQFGSGSAAKPYNKIARIDATGKLDETFKSPETGVGDVDAISPVSANRFLVGRRGASLGNQAEKLTLVSSEGVADKKFALNLRQCDVYQILNLSDGSYVLIGNFSTESDSYGVLRLAKS